MLEQTAPPRIIGILGSSRNDGNTGALASAVFGHLENAQLISLSDYSIAPYDYENKSDADDFLTIARLMVEAEVIVFASPVYWYSMSAQMKTLFDRISSLTDRHKSLGRQLAGKTVFVLSTGGSPTVPQSFEQPFIDTAQYFDMHWGKLLYASLSQDRKLSPEAALAAKDFSVHINTVATQDSIVPAP